jgi:hypothetical protein
MARTITVPRWADRRIKHRAREKARFKLCGFNEICRMTSSEWDEECRRNNADFEEYPEEAYVRECIEAREKGLDPHVDDRGRLQKCDRQWSVKFPKPIGAQVLIANGSQAVFAEYD